MKAEIIDRERDYCELRAKFEKLNEFAFGRVLEHTDYLLENPKNLLIADRTGKVDKIDGNVVYLK